MELNPEQVASFEEDGYLAVGNIFDAAEVGTLCDEADALLELLVNSSLANGRLSGRVDMRAPAPGIRVVRKVQPFVDVAPAFARLARDSRVLQPVARLLGSEAELMEDKFTFKQILADPLPGLPVREGMDDHFHAHADYAYHAAHGYPRSIVTCAIALDNCVDGKGPFHVWPGTHTAYIPHESFGEASFVVPRQRLDGDGRDVVVRAGSVIFFSDLLVHSSGPNMTGEPRRVVFFSYCPRGSVNDADVRNGPLRRSEEPYEARYRALRDAGAYRDTFRIHRAEEVRA